MHKDFGSIKMKLKQGDKKTSKRKGDLKATVWKDKQNVHTVMNLHHHHPSPEVYLMQLK
jgi:hypothetical protein